MSKFFNYTRVEQSPVQIEGQEPKTKEVVDVINLNKVIRALLMPEGHLLVLLDDLHTRKQEVPMYNKKKEITGYKHEMGTFQSEIFITKKEDIENFYKLAQ